MPKFFTNAENGPAKFTGLATGSWDTDIDLDLDATFVGDAPTIPAEATGVILRFMETGSAVYNIGARHPDSTTNRIEDIGNTGGNNQINAYVGINSAHEIDLYIGNSAVEVYLIGYFTAEANFLSDINQLTFNIDIINTWETIDLSAKISVDAIFAIVEVQRTTATSGYNFRHPSSSDNRTHANNVQHAWVIVPVDSQNVEMWSESAFTTFVLVGEITANAVNKTSGVDVSLSTTGSYQTVDFSGDSPPTNAVFAIVEFDTTTWIQWAVRRYGDTSYADIYGDAWGQASSWSIFPVIDSNDSENERCQVKIESTGLDFYVWGYITEAGGTTAALLPIIMNDQTISMIGKKSNTGSVKIAAGSATLENSGKEGLNASLSSTLDSNISILSGSKGNTGELSTIIDIVIAMLGFESEVIFSGVLNTSLDPQSILYSGSKGNAGIIDTQIQNLINLILGVKGNTARVDINVFTETELFAKLGTSGKLNIILDDLEIRLIEVTITDEIFKILVSMKTGQITILGPKTGTINIEGLS